MDFCTVSRVRARIAIAFAAFVCGAWHGVANGVIAIAFAAFACIKQLMYRIKPKALSPEVIRNALIHVGHSVCKHKRTQKSYVMPAQINPEAKKIYAMMGLKATTTPPVLICADWYNS